MSTKAQKWAQRRNFAKGRVRAIQTQLSGLSNENISPFMTDGERTALKKALSHVKWVSDYWDYRNKLSRKRTLNGD